MHDACKSSLINNVNTQPLSRANFYSGCKFAAAKRWNTFEHLPGEIASDEADNERYRETDDDKASECDADDQADQRVGTAWCAACRCAV